jgi:hypothetical protein
MTVIQMSDRELSRLRVMIDLADGRLTLEAAGTLMGIGRRQVFRLCRAFEASGASLDDRRTNCNSPAVPFPTRFTLDRAQKTWASRRDFRCEEDRRSRPFFGRD